MGLFDDQKAFSQFFDEDVFVEGFRGLRRVRVTVKACVIDAGFAEIDADAVAGSDEHVYSVRVKMDEWPEVDPPRKGDVIRTSGGTVLRVTSCDVDSSWYELHAKSKGGV